MDERVKITIRDAIAKSIKNYLDNPNIEVVDEVLGDTNIPKTPQGFELQENLDYAVGLYEKVEFRILPDDPEPCGCCERGNFIGNDTKSNCRSSEHAGCGHPFSKHRYEPKEPVK